MKKIILACLLVASSSAFATMETGKPITYYPSDLKCNIVQSVNGKEIKNVTLLTSEQPAHVINEEVGKSHVLSILLSGDYNPQTTLIRLFSNSKPVFSAAQNSNNMCDTIDIHGSVRAGNIEVSYRCEMVCSPVR